MDKIKKNILFGPVLGSILGVSSVMIIIGITLIIIGNSNRREDVVSKEENKPATKEIDYTDCENYYSDNITCLELMRDSQNTHCTCYMTFQLEYDLVGNVTLYYTLKNFEISQNSSSRDDKQLAGELSNVPSEACEPYRYDADGRPIAPCGALAESMFNDEYVSVTLQDPTKSNLFVSRIHSGMIPEEYKTHYRNPPGNLRTAFQNFSKPKSWMKNVWELDLQDVNNNGFQNERFIGWMNTDLKVKPAWRVNATGLYKIGLPKGNYTIKIIWNYPPSLYNVRRILIFEAKRGGAEINTSAYGLTLLIIGVVMILLAALFVTCVVVVYKTEKDKSKVESPASLRVSRSNQEAGGMTSPAALSDDEELTQLHNKETLAR